jgi:hypothetical protein
MTEPLRYRRSSLRTMLGITTEEKRIKRELGITALLRPFRWWGNEKRDVKRELGYYSPEAKFARHVLPRSTGKLVLLAMVLSAIPLLMSWLKSSQNQNAMPTAAAESSDRSAERGRVFK